MLYQAPGKYLESGVNLRIVETKIQSQGFTEKRMEGSEHVSLETLNAMLLSLVLILQAM